MNAISFPADEHNAVRKRLDAGLSVVTTRVENEIGKYRPGQMYRTQWGEILEVTFVQPYLLLEDHPYHSELTAEWLRQLEGKPGEMVVLRKAR